MKMTTLREPPAPPTERSHGTGEPRKGAPRWWSPRRVLVASVACIAVLTLCGGAAAWLVFLRDIGELDTLPAFGQLFDLNTEFNVPTWFSATQLVFAAVIAWSVARVDRGYRWHWSVLGVLLAFIAVDEIAQVHEWVGEMLHQRFDTSGALYFAWVIPYGLAAIVLGLAYLKFWLAMPRDTRLLMLAAAVLLVGGAIGLELAEGLWATHVGYGRVMRALCLVEECAEMLGVAVLVYAMLGYRERLRAGR